MFATTSYRCFAPLSLTAALAALLLAAACGKIENGTDDDWKELDGDRAMHFATAVTTPATKAAEPLPVGGTFGVFAFLQEGDIQNHNPASWTGHDWYPSFMFNQLVTFDGTEYNYSPIKYWPNNEENTISFWAYSPHNPSAVLYKSGTTESYTNASFGIPDVHFSVTDGKEDFMTSDFVADKTYANCADESSEKGRVKFDFHHRLSQVEFKVKPDADYVTGVPADEQVTFKVKKIEILFSYNTGDFHQDPSSNAIAWNNLAGEQVAAESGGIVAFNNASGLAVGTDPAHPTDVSASFLLPQSLRHDGVTESGKDVMVRVTYTQAGGGMEGERVATRTMYTTSYTQWDPNYHYTYTLVLKPNDGLHIIVEVQEWEKLVMSSDYTENVTVTGPMTFDATTYSSFTTGQEFTIENVKSDYTVVALKSGTTLKGFFTFDTPYNGTWYAVLEPVGASTSDGSILFDNNQSQISGTVGDEAVIRIKARSESVSSNQFARLRVFCVTPDGQVLPVQEGSFGGNFIIAQYVN